MNAILPHYMSFRPTFLPLLKSPALQSGALCCHDHMICSVWLGKALGSRLSGYVRLLEVFSDAVAYNHGLDQQGTRQGHREDA